MYIIHANNSRLLVRKERWPVVVVSDIWKRIEASLRCVVGPLKLNPAAAVTHLTYPTKTSQNYERWQKLSKYGDISKVSRDEVQLHVEED